MEIAAIPEISILPLSNCWILPVWVLLSPNMTSDVAATIATTVAPFPVSNNNTAALVGVYTSADEREQTTFSSVQESSSKDLAVDEADEGGDEKEPQPAATKKSIRFFAFIAALASSGLLTSLQATITSTALPTIIADLGGADLYVWIINGFYLTQYVECSALFPPDFPFLV